MGLVPSITRDMVPEQFKEAFDELVSSRGGVADAVGPRSAMIYSAEMLRRADRLLDFLRKESVLSNKIQRLAMLTTARATDCQFVWNIHVAEGRKAGLNEGLVNALRDKNPLPTGSPAYEAVVVSYGLEFFRTHKVSEETFHAALAQFGVRGLTELTTLMGYYVLLAFNAKAFDADQPAKVTELLPI